MTITELTGYSDPKMRGHGRNWGAQWVPGGVSHPGPISLDPRAAPPARAALRREGPGPCGPGPL